MSSKEKVLAIRPDYKYTCIKHNTRSGGIIYAIYQVYERFKKRIKTGLHYTEPEAWAAAYKYLTK